MPHYWHMPGEAPGACKGPDRRAEVPNETQIIALATLACRCHLTGTLCGTIIWLSSALSGCQQTPHNYIEGWLSATTS
jgi:hypothetical protein